MILREPGSTQPGSYLAFLVRIQTVDPSAFEMPDAPANKAGAFIFEEDSQEVHLWHKADIPLRLVMSATGGKADMLQTSRNVRF